MIEFTVLHSTKAPALSLTLSIGSYNSVFSCCELVFALILYIYLIIANSALGLPWWLSGKESKNLPASSGDRGSIPGSGRTPGEGNGHPLEYSCLGNPMEWKSLVGYSPWGCQGVGHVLVTKQQQIQQKTLAGRDTELCFQGTERVFMIRWKLRRVDR